MNYKMIKKIILFIQLTILVISVIQPICLFAQSEESGYEVIVDSKGNEVIQLALNADAGIIRIKGTHNYSGSKIAYLTVGYTLALNKNIANSKNSIQRNGTKNKDFIEVEREDSGIDDKISNNTVTSYYQITIDNNFIQNMFSVWKNTNGKNSEDKVGSKSWYEYRQDLKNGIKVYMSYIFAVIHRDSAGKILSQSGWFSNTTGAKGTLYYTYKAIRDAIDWSDRTKYEILPEYYDLSFTIKLNTYTPKIEFVDTQGNLLVASEEIYAKYPGKGEGYCLYGGSFIYYLPKDAQNIIIDGKKYFATKEARYYHGSKMDESKLALNIKGDLTGHLPYYRYAAKHDFNDDALLQIVFVPEDTPIEVTAIDIDSKKVIEKIPCEKVYKELETEVLLEDLPEQIYDNLGQEYQLIWEDASNNNPTWTMSYYRKGSNPQYYTPNNKYGIGVKRQMVVYITNSSFDRTKPIKMTAYYKKTKEEIKQEEDKNTIEVNYTDPKIDVYIGADKRREEKFDISLGIPASEGLYTWIKAKEYLLKAVFVQVKGKKEIPVTVKRTYRLNWQEATPTPLPDEEDSIQKPPIYHSETVVVNKTITLTREYSFTYIDKIAYYKIHSGIVENAVFSDDIVTLIPKNYTLPSIDYQSLGNSLDAHIILPNEVKNGSLDLGVKVLDGGYSGRPSITESESVLKSLADSKVGELKCRNDSLTFDGKTVLDATLKEKEAPEPIISALTKPEMITEDVLFQENLIIPKETKNQSYPTTATLRYTPIVTFGDEQISEIYEIKELKPVIVHTPVYCKGVIEADNEPYVQLLSPELSSTALVLDENSLLNDFWVSISNSGFHSDYLGYQTRDYKKYVALDSEGNRQNQVRFPFDIVLDIGNDFEQNNDQILSAGTWFTLGDKRQRMYLPMYIKEGNYTCEFRSLASNTGSQIEATEENKNTQRKNYVATDFKTFQVSGRLYGLNLYDIDDIPRWSDIFRDLKTSVLKRNLELSSGVTDEQHFKPESFYDYTVGIKDSYGNLTNRVKKFTLPLCEGSHPLYQNQGFYRNGYLLRFLLHTTGEVMSNPNSYVQILPKFFWVDAKGKNRECVDVYYKEKLGKEIKLIKIGSQEDRENQKIQMVGGVGLGIPKKELQTTAQILESPIKELEDKKVEQYSYGLIQAGLPFRTYSNLEYFNSLKPLIQKEGLQIPKEQQIWKLKQTYYITYNLPSEIYIAATGIDLTEEAKEKGISYQEDFWKRDGYLIINFQITAIDQNKKEYLDYGNFTNKKAYSHCCMWEMEGGLKEKELYKNQKISLEYGDVLILKVKEGNALSDYQTGGIY